MPSMEDTMAAKITAAQIRSRVAADADDYAVEFLPPDSFARHAFETKPYPVRNPVRTGITGTGLTYKRGQ